MASPWAECRAIAYGHNYGLELNALHAKPNIGGVNGGLRASEMAPGPQPTRQMRLPWGLMGCNYIHTITYCLAQFNSILIPFKTAKNNRLIIQSP